MIPPFQTGCWSNPSNRWPARFTTCSRSPCKNGTANFTASNDFRVKLRGQVVSDSYRNGEWKPKQIIVFYVLTKKYYPLSPVSGGFILDLGGASSTLIPGPSGIFLRLKYNPATFAKTLNWIVAYGPGKREQCVAAKYGLPNTSIYEIVAAAMNLHMILAATSDAQYARLSGSKVLMRTRTNCRPIPNVRFVSFLSWRGALTHAPTPDHEIPSRSRAI